MSLRRASASAVENLESRLLLARPLGIDVSHFQGTINWNAVSASGITFAYAKATEGFTFNDDKFVQNMDAATAAGVKIGGYHFARPDNQPNAIDEVQHYLQIAGPYIRAGFLVPALDVENPVQAGDQIDTKAEMSQWVNDWCNGVLAATGVRPIIYTFASYANSFLDSTVTQWPLWMRSTNGQIPQVGSPTTTAPWPTWNLWQYQVAPGVPGIAGDVDRDVYNGDFASFSSSMVIGGVATQAEITVTGMGVNVQNNSPTPFTVTARQDAASSQFTFAIRNDGNGILSTAGLTVPAGFSVVDPLDGTLAPGASDTFTVALSTAAVGTFAGNITFANNDADENPFVIPVRGTVTNPVILFGNVFHDLNSSRTRDAGDAALSGWTVYLDSNNNAALDAGEPQTVTSATGDYQFSDLPYGTYVIRQILQNNFRQTTFPTAFTVNATAPGYTEGSYDFGNIAMATVGGIAWNDANGDRVRQSTEALYVGATVFIDRNLNGRYDAGEPSDTTDFRGVYSFTLVPNQTYRVVMAPPGSTYVSTTTRYGFYDVTPAAGARISNLNFGWKKQLFQFP